MAASGTTLAAIEIAMHSIDAETVRAWKPLTSGQLMDITVSRAAREALSTRHGGRGGVRL